MIWWIDSKLAMSSYLKYWRSSGLIGSPSFLLLLTVLSRKMMGR